MFASAIDIAVKYWPMFWAGIKTTLLLSITGTVIGLLIGLVVGSVRSVCSKASRGIPASPRRSKRSSISSPASMWSSSAAPR